MRASSTRRRTAWAVVAVLVLVGCLAGPAMAAGGAKKPPAPPTPAALADQLGVSAQNPIPCGWMVDVSAQTLNVAAPDTHTNYFVQPYYLTAGNEIVLHGVYPFSRYFSFIAYGSDGLPINNVSIHDQQIIPDAGSVNPFSTATPPTDPSQRHYTLHISSSQPPFPSNTIAGLPSGVAQGLGFLLYRIYLPDDSNDPAAGVPLPTITTASGAHRTCSSAERAVYNRLFAPLANYLVEQSAPDVSKVKLGASLFRRAGDLGGLFPNPDNQYVFQASTWKAQRIIVIRGKAMSFPDTRNGGSTTEQTDVRYWSMCSNELEAPFPAVDCASDDDTVLDGQGYYTYVVSMAQDRPQNASAENGVTWLAWAPAGTGDVPDNTTYLRTMLPGDGFDHAVQSVEPPQPHVPAVKLAQQASTAMAEYYPQGVLCTTKTFEAGGAGACFHG